MWEIKNCRLGNCVVNMVLVVFLTLSDMLTLVIERQRKQSPAISAYPIG